MSRDMKPRKTQQPAKKKSWGGTVIGMFIGLVLGVAVAAGVVLYMNKAPIPFVNKAPAKTEAPAQGSAPVAATKPAPQPVALPGKPGDPVPEKRFQFYDILPGKADAVPDKPGAAKPAAGAQTSEVKDDSKQPVFLQAGSFANPQEADNLKAKLAFMGQEALVQQVMVQDKTFYRVRVGPFYRAEEWNKVRTDLAKGGIETQVARN